MPDTATAATYVLVPGAWMGGWSWHPVARLLHDRGHEVLTPTLPGLSYGSSAAGLRLVDAVDHIVDEVERRDLHDVVLVAHSWGGYPATAAAHRLAPRIARVVYYNAVVPEQGRAMSEENEQYGQAIRDAVAATPDATVALPLEAVRFGLMPDEPPELQELVFAMALPQPGGYMVDPVDVPPVTALGLPTAYILGVDDRSLARPGTEFAARIGIEPVPIPGGHMTLLSHPAVVADALLGLR